MTFLLEIVCYVVIPHYLCIWKQAKVCTRFFFTIYLHRRFAVGSLWLRFYGEDMVNPKWGKTALNLTYPYSG